MAWHDEIRTINFGLNSIEQENVDKFVEVVEKDGVADAFWSCTGRTLHRMLASQLADKLPQYEFDIDYQSYLCRAKKKSDIINNEEGR